MKPACPFCGGPAVLTTLLACGTTPPHDHDLNRLTCANGDTFGHICPVVGCEWKSPHQPTKDADPEFKETYAKLLANRDRRRAEAAWDE